MWSIILWVGELILENLLVEYIKKKFKAGKNKMKSITKK